jgi:hypothetical protein
LKEKIEQNLQKKKSRTTFAPHTQTNHFTMRTIVAIKNGRKKTFTERTWDLLGPRHEGYVEIPDVEIKNIVAKPAAGTKATPNKPATGNKGPQTIHNTTPAKGEEQQVTNTAAADAGEQSQPDSKSSDTAVTSEEQKNEFLNAAKGTTGGVIKDYFDGCTPKVKYKKSASQNELIDQLGEVLGWDVIEFQKLFS